MSNPFFTMTKRKAWMMPTPFVLNDAVIIKQKVKVSLKAVEQISMNAGKPKRIER
jgi:hypothetical protein